jgi:hypothetical protein
MNSAIPQPGYPVASALVKCHRPGPPLHDLKKLEVMVLPGPDMRRQFLVPLSYVSTRSSQLFSVAARLLPSVVCCKTGSTTSQAVGTG